MRFLLGIIHEIAKRLSYPRRVDIHAISGWYHPHKGELSCDIGCGDGYWDGRLARRKGTRFVGIDVNSEAVKKAKKFKQKDCTFVIADTHALPFKSHVFDHVISLSVLQFVKDDQKVLFEIKRVLKKEASVILTCDSLSSKILSHAYRKKHQKKYQTRRYYNLEQLATIMDEAGFEVIASRYAVCSVISIFLFMLQEWFGKVSYLGTPILLPLILVADKCMGSQTTGGYKLAVFARPKS